MPPKASPKTHTMSPQPALAKPASRDHRPRGATSSQRPSPSWIHTEAAAAWIGWSDPDVAPLFTRCCTQPGEPAAGGLEHARRETERHGGLDLQQPVEDPEAAEADAENPPGGWLRRRELWSRGERARPSVLSRRYWMLLTTFQPMAHTAPTRRTTRSWWNSAAWNAETMTEFPACSERPMPGMGYRSPSIGGAAEVLCTASRHYRRSRACLPSPSVRLAAVRPAGGVRPSRRRRL